MNELILYLLGFRIYKFEKEDLVHLSRLMFRNNFPLNFKSEIIYMPLYKCKRFEKIISERIKFLRSDRRGIGGFLINNLKNVPFAIASLAIGVGWYLSSLVVWDIRVSGNESVDSQTVIDELSESGFKIGSFWHRTDTSKIELSLLAKSDTVSWININRQGTVAYVRVLDKLDFKDEVMTGYANLVADSDGVIEEITVKQGRAAVKVGDTVKKGDLLISGILSDGTFTYAQGSVIARKSETVSVTASQKFEKKEYTGEKLKAVYVNFFNKKINILKIPRNLDIKCDIICLDSSISLFGRDLPMFFSVEKVQSYEISECTYTDDVLTNMASVNLNQKLNERLANATLIKIRCDGRFVEGGYLMWAELVFSENIATPLPFLTD